ncbi:MAG: hypothetical protein ACREIR_04565 [Geminicoccaceae bacterium]
MGSRHILAALGLLLAPGAAVAAEIDDFFGDWRGVEVSIDDDAGQSLQLAATDLDMAIAGQDGGFRIRGFGLARKPEGALVLRPIDAMFAPTETPGVFAYEPAAGSLLSRLFADPTLGNPLEGDTLLWARLQDDALHVYSLAIDDRGGFALEHSTGQLTKDGMTARYVLRLENEQIVMVEGRLERAGD